MTIEGPLRLDAPKEDADNWFINEGVELWVSRHRAEQSDTNDALPTEDEKIRFGQLGLETDLSGRPIHPWASRILALTGVIPPEGKGYFYNWGPNYTADALVWRHDLTTPHLLLVKRSDTSEWALPGGFIDSEDTDTETAAIREVLEESWNENDDKPTVDLRTLEPIVKKIYSGPVHDFRMTLNAWPETTAYSFHLPKELTKHMPVGPYPVKDVDGGTRRAVWTPSASVPVLFGAHSLLVGLDVLGEQTSL